MNHSFYYVAKLIRELVQEKLKKVFATPPGCISRIKTKFLRNVLSELWDFSYYIVLFVIVAVIALSIWLLFALFPLLISWIINSFSAP